VSWDGGRNFSKLGYSGTQDWTNSRVLAGLLTCPCVLCPDGAVWTPGPKPLDWNVSSSSHMLLFLGLPQPICTSELRELKKQGSDQGPINSGRG
jgi:hypothetical protein